MQRLKSNIGTRKKCSTCLGRLFLLNGLQILYQVLQAHISKILIVFDLVKNRAPHRHFPRTMGSQRGVVPSYEFANSF